MGKGSAFEVSLFLLLLKISRYFCKNGEGGAIWFASRGTGNFFSSCAMLSSHLKMFSVLSYVRYLNVSAKLCVLCFFSVCMI